MRYALPLLVMIAASMSLGGCARYRLQGKVVAGRASSVTVVDQHDPRLEQAGLPGASVEVTLDPKDLGRRMLPAATSGEDGSFAVPIDEMGAGFLEYHVRVLSRARGHQSAHGEMPLPGSDKRLLIILAPGRDTYQPPPTPEGFLEETMQMSEPYLRSDY